MRKRRPSDGRERPRVPGDYTVILLHSHSSGGRVVTQRGGRYLPEVTQETWWQKSQNMGEFPILLSARLLECLPTPSLPPGQVVACLFAWAMWIQFLASWAWVLCGQVQGRGTAAGEKTGHGKFSRRIWRGQGDLAHPWPSSLDHSP